MPVVRVQSGPHQGTQWRLSKSATMRIGNDPGCEIWLPEDATIERRHALVRYVSGRWLIEALTPQGLKVNSGGAVRLAWLEPNDSIELSPGGTVLEFTSRSARLSRTLRGKTPPPLPQGDGEETADGEKAVDEAGAAADSRKWMLWPMLACAGVVAVSAVTAVAVVILVGVILLSQNKQQAAAPPATPPATAPPVDAGKESPPVQPATPPKVEPPTQSPPIEAPPANGSTTATAPPVTPPAVPTTNPPGNTAPPTEVASNSPTPPPVTPPTTSPPPDSGNSQLWKEREAGVFLIEVLINPAEGKAAGFGTAWAADKQRLIVTAGQALEIAGFLKARLAVVAVRQSDQTPLTVQSAIPHPRYQQLKDRPQQMCFDVGVIRLSEPTTFVPELADATDFQRPNLDIPVTSIGVPGGFEESTNVMQPQINVIAGKLLGYEALPGGGAALLLMNIDVRDDIYGSPIFTEDGKVLGTYIGSAGPEARQKLGFPLHRAAAIGAVKEMLGSR